MLADRETLERADELVRRAWWYLRPKPFEGIDREALASECADMLSLRRAWAWKLTGSPEGTLELARELRLRAEPTYDSERSRDIRGHTMELLGTVCLVHVRQMAEDDHSRDDCEDWITDCARDAKRSIDFYRKGYASVPRDPRVGGLLNGAGRAGDDYLAGWNAGVRDAKRVSETYLRERDGSLFVVDPVYIGPSLFRMTGNKGTFELVSTDTLDAVPGVTMTWAGGNRVECACGDMTLDTVDWGPGSQSDLRYVGDQMQLDVVLGDWMDLPSEVTRTSGALVEMGRHVWRPGDLWPGSSYLDEQEGRERQRGADEAADLLPEGYGNDLSGVTESRRERRLHMPFAEDPYERTTLAKNDYEDQVAQTEGDGQEAMLGVDVDAEVTDTKDNYALALEEARRTRQGDAPEPVGHDARAEDGPERDRNGRQR